MAGYYSSVTPVTDEEDVDSLEQLYGRGIGHVAHELGEHPALVASDGDGDDAVFLFRFSDGREVVMTNGDPCWEGESGFEELKFRLGKH